MQTAIRRELLPIIGRQKTVQYVQKSASSALLISAALTALLAVFVRLSFVQTYGTNDDVGLSMICSGSGWSKVPDPHLMFTNILIGWSLASLYAYLPNLPWYGCYLEFANLIGIFAITLSLLSVRSRLTGVFTALIFFVAVAINNLCFLHFTTAACLLGIGGLALIMTWYEQHVVTPNPAVTDSLGFPIAGVVLLIACSLMRFQSLVLVLLLFGCYCAVRFFLDRNTTRQSLRLKLALTLIATLALLVSLGFKQLDNAVYAATPGWDDFIEANQLIAKLVDFGYGRSASQSKINQVLEQTGWTANDLKMIQNLFCFDTYTFSVSKIRTTASLLEGGQLKSPKEAWRCFTKIFRDENITPMLIGCVFLFLFGKSESLSRIGSTLLALSILLLMSVLIVGFKLQPHIYIPMFAFLTFVLLFHFDRTTAHSPFSMRIHNVIAWAVALIVLGCIGTISYRTCQQHGKFFYQENRILKRSIAALQPNDNQLFLTWGGFFPYHLILPFDDIHSYFVHFDHLPLALRGNNPLATSTMRRHNIQLDALGKGLIQRTVYIVSAPYLNEMLKVYLKEHYQLDAEICKVPFDQGNFQLFQVRTAIAHHDAVENANGRHP